MTLNDKVDLYFNDHDFTPLMVQENYLNTIPSKAGNNKQKHLEAVLKAAESIADGDLVDARIHSSDQQWGLMPLHAVMSSVRPASFIAGQAREGITLHRIWETILSEESMIDYCKNCIRT